MTLLTLHELVDTMIADSGGKVPTSLKLEEDLDPFALHAFLLSKQRVTFIDTPNHAYQVRTQ